MKARFPSLIMGIPLRIALGNILTVANVIVWYSCASAILKGVISEICFINCDALAFYIVMFLSTVISILAGASISLNKSMTRRHFLLIWTLLGVGCSLALAILEIPTEVNVLLVMVLVGISFGLGVPMCMANFAESTIEQNRARLGSIVLLSTFLGIFVFGAVLPSSLPLSALVLAFWRLLGSAGVFLMGDAAQNKKRSESSSSLIGLCKDRSMLLYLIPWTMFSIVNYLSWPILSKIYGEDAVNFSVLVNNIVVGVFALAAGFLADNNGRKRVLVWGFIIFGVGYALLGIAHSNIYSWYIYSVADGIAWGIIYVIFWFTIWGDLARGKSSEKYYAAGFLPYSLSGFLRVTVGPFLADAVSEYAIFSFAAFFLFLAVVPLMYAPETLPEKTIRERELWKYIRTAKKIKEKHV